MVADIQDGEEHPSEELSRPETIISSVGSSCYPATDQYTDSTPGAGTLSIYSLCAVSLSRPWLIYEPYSMFHKQGETG